MTTGRINQVAFLRNISIAETMHDGRSNMEYVLDKSNLKDRPAIEYSASESTGNRTMHHARNSYD